MNSEIRQWLESLDGASRTEAKRLLKSQELEMARGYSQDHEPFVSMSIDALDGAQADDTLANIERLNSHNVFMGACAAHGYLHAYVQKARGEYRCYECDRDSRRRSYHKAMKDPERRAKERARQRDYRARNREEYNAAARQRYAQRKQDVTA